MVEVVSLRKNASLTLAYIYGNARNFLRRAYLLGPIKVYRIIGNHSSRLSRVLGLARLAEPQGEAGRAKLSNPNSRTQRALLLISKLAAEIDMPALEASGLFRPKAS